MGRFFLAFFGVASRRAVRDYLVFTGLFALILLAVAWTIDLADNFDEVQWVASVRQQPLYEVLLPYLTYRAVDIVLRLLPVSIFFGIFIAEIYRRARLDTVILSAAGAGPLRLLGPIALYGAIMGAGNWALESYGRPAAVEAQIKLGAGTYYHRFRPGVWYNEEPRWFLYGDTAIRAEVYRDTPPALANVLVFQGMQSDMLSAAYFADRMTAQDLDGNWTLDNVTIWDVGEDEGSTLETLDLHLEIIPEELVYHNIPGFYLYTSALNRLMEAHPGSVARIWADAALWRRNTIFLVPFVVAGLALSLARLGFLGRMPHVPRLIALGAFGYVTVVSIKVFFAIGEEAGMTAAYANIAPLIGIGAVTALLTLRAMIR